MPSLTYAIVLVMGLSGVLIGKAQETVEPLFLDTTLIPVVELSIKNAARTPASSIHDVYTISRATRTLRDTAYTEKSPIVEAVISSSSKMPTVTEYSHDLTPSDIASDGKTVTILSPVSSWGDSIMPSFSTEKVTSHTFTKTIPPLLLENVASTILEPSESSTILTPNFASVLQENGTLLHTATTNVLDVSSHLPFEKSEGDMKLYEATEELETTWQVSKGTSVERAIPTNQYISETESIRNGHNMVYDQFDTTATISVSPDATSTNTLKTEVMELDQKVQDHSHPKRLSFVLKKRCSDDKTVLETSETLNEQLVGMINNTMLLNENQSAFICERVFHVTVPIKNMTDSMIRETVKNLTRNFTFKDNFRLEKIYLYKNDHSKMVLFSVDALDQSANNYDGYTLSERELIAYIVAGISLGTLIFILLTCCCVRFLCNKQTTSLDLCDIPHLNLKLEDYKLTPIPRPTISFSEYGRELFNPSYNEHTPKLEDTVLNQHHFTVETASPGARESLSFPREMRTFGGKKSCSRVQSLDARPNARSGNGWISNSREKLSTDFERRNSGFDNVAFRKWF